MRKMIVDEGNPGLIAWKCAVEDFDFGTQLVVHESQQAVFFRDGQALEVLGPGMHILETTNLPFLKRLLNGVFGRKSFHCEIYFVNQSVSMSMPWGTRERARVMIEVEPGKKLPLSVGAGGTMNVQADPDQTRKLLTYLVGTGKSLTKEGLQEIFMSMINANVKSYIAQAVQDGNYNIFDLDRHIPDVGAALYKCIAPEFEKYGIILRELYLERLVMPEDDPAYQKALLLQSQKYTQTSEMELRLGLDTMEVRHGADMAKIKGEQTVTEATAEAQASVIRAQAEAARRKLEGISSVQEHQFETLNKMVENGGSAGAGTGGDMTGMFSDVMKMGVGLQMMKEAGSVVKDAMDQGKSASDAIMTSVAGTWKCACGKDNPEASKFCAECGGAKPLFAADWVCSCGHKNPASGKFCAECGSARPAADWICSCGHKNSASGKFCAECGTAKA